MRDRVHWVRRVHQARSAETLQRILDSAEELIAEKGFADVPVAEIARRAGFSVGAVYSRFRDKDALLHCLEDRLIQEARVNADVNLDPARWEGASIAEIAEELIAFMVQIHRERLGILRELLGRAHTVPEVGVRTEQAIAYVCERLHALLLQRRAEIRHPEPELAAKFAGHLVLGVLKEAVLFCGTGAYGVPQSDAKLARELTRAFLGYLGVGSPQSGD